MGHTYTSQFPVVYLTFKFNWVSFPPPTPPHPPGLETPTWGKGHLRGDEGPASPSSRIGTMRRPWKETHRRRHGVWSLGRFASGCGLAGCGRGSGAPRKSPVDVGAVGVRQRRGRRKKEEGRPGGNSGNKGGCPGQEALRGGGRPPEPRRQAGRADSWPGFPGALLQCRHSLGGKQLTR